MLPTPPIPLCIQLSRLLAIAVFAVALVVAGGEARAGILLSSGIESSSALGASVEQELGGGPAGDFHRPFGDEERAPIHLGEREGMATSPTSNPNTVPLAYGDVSHELVSVGGLLVVAYRFEVLLALTNPFLDGILRPPESESKPNRLLFGFGL